MARNRKRYRVLMSRRKKHAGLISYDKSPQSLGKR
jgi:hypothetical protein